MKFTKTPLIQTLLLMTFAITAIGCGRMNIFFKRASSSQQAAPPSGLTLVLRDPNTLSNTKTNQSTVTASITGDTDATKWCLIEQDAAAAIPSAPSASDPCFVTPRPSTAELGVTGSRKAYLYTLDGSSVVSSSAAIAEIDYRTVAPASPTLALSDPTTSSTSYARQTTVSATVGSDASAVKWCLSATQTTQPTLGTSPCNGGAGPGDGWLTARPTSALLPTGNGAKTLTLWVADEYNNVSTTAVTDTITLDGTPPATPTVTVQDPVTLSSSTVHAIAANLAITGDTDAVKWCVIEQAGAATAPSAPLFNDACWVNSRPATLDIGSGSRKVYAYTKDIAENVSAAAAVATFTRAAPSKLTILGDLSIDVNECKAYRLAADDSADWPTELLANTSVTISSNNSSSLYSDSSCSATASSVTISRADSTAIFYMKGSASGTITVSASASGFSAGTLAVEAYPARTGVIAISTGLKFSCFLLDTGTVKCTGNGWNEGEMGDGNWVNYNTPVAVSGITTAKQIASGDNFTCARLANGTVKCWGSNWGGQLGNGVAGDSASPVNVSGITNAVAISAGSNHACAVLATGAVSCWGYNGVGQIGDGTTTSRTTPVTVPGISTAVGIAAGILTSCALLQDGTVRCWGDNSSGSFGDGTTVSSLTPVLSPSLKHVTQLSMVYQGCAAINDGTLKCWGPNWSADVGDGTYVAKTSPVAISGITSLIDIAAFTNYTCAILKTGAAKCWGDNDAGQLGTGDMSSHAAPTNVTAATSLRTFAKGKAHRHTCAGLDDGTARCWGNLAYGEGGDGVDRDLAPSAVAGLAGVTALGLGFEHSCAVENGGAAGKVKCWGANGSDRLGTGTWVSTHTPTEVLQLTGAVKVASGQQHSCALLNDNTLKCWGANNVGQLGNGTYVNASDPPAVVTGIANASALSVGVSSTCASLSDGTVKCWGQNSDGQLGDGTTTDRISPVIVSGISTAAGVALGRNHACALLSDGTAQCWGANSNGELGNGSTTSSLAPVTVTGLAGATAIAASQGSSCALINDGTVRCWGANWSGQLGDGTTTSRNTPVAVTGVSNAIAIAQRGSTACALINDGTIQCWGNNPFGQLATGDKTARVTAVTIPGITTAAAVSVGHENVCASLANGSVQCWGGNGRRQSGSSSHSITAVTPILP